MTGRKVVVGLVALGLFLLVVIAWTSWAQGPDPEVEPEPPIRAPQGDGTPASSSAAEPALSEPVVAEVSAEAWHSSAALPAGIPAERLSSPDGASQVVDEAVLQTLVSHRVTGSALRPRTSDVTYTVYWTGGCSYATSDDGHVWNTPLHLPQGATVKYLRMYYRDTSASNSSGWFSLYDLYGGLVDEWLVQSTGDTGEGFRDTDLIDHTINYNSYSYLLNWRPNDASSDMQLCGFRIFYERPPTAVALPFVPKSYP
jgi:hypothetical protein